METAAREHPAAVGDFGVGRSFSFCNMLQAVGCGLPSAETDMKLIARHRAHGLALLCAVSACDTTDEGDVAADKAAIADEAEAGGKADHIDICAAWDWYDDDFCDDPYGWCALPDPDCGPDGDSCAEGWTWSGLPDEGCVLAPEPEPEPAVFSDPVVVGQRPSTAFEMRGWASVAVDDAGGVHLVYPDWARRLTYASPTDAWAPHLLEDLDVYGGLSIAAAADVHVAVIDSEYDLHYLRLSGASIADREVVSDYARSIGIATDGTQAHLVFGAGELTSGLAAASGTIGAMTTSGVAALTNIDEARNGPSVTVDADGVVHTLYGTDPVAYNLSGQSQVRHAWRDASGTWSDELVAPATWEGGAITVQADGSLFATYRAFVNGAQTLMIADNAGGSWATQPLFGAGVLGTAGNTATAGDGTVHVVYRRDGGVQHVQRSPGGEWTDPVVLDPSVSMTSSDRISIAIGPDDSVHVAYADTQTRDVRYVSRP